MPCTARIREFVFGAVGFNLSKQSGFLTEDGFETLEELVILQLFSTPVFHPCVRLMRYQKFSDKGKNLNYRVDLSERDVAAGNPRMCHSIKGLPQVRWNHHAVNPVSLVSIRAITDRFTQRFGYRTLCDYHSCFSIAVLLVTGVIGIFRKYQQKRPPVRCLSSRETPTVRAIRRASPSVVNLHGQKTVRTTAAGMAGATGPESFKHVNGMGTGVIVDPRGYVITNYHVVEDVEKIFVTLADGREVTAELVAARVRNDLALVKIQSTEALPTIPRGTSEDLMVGESVIAIGNAFGYVHTSTQGIISALHRDVPVNEKQEYRDLIQTSAGINPGTGWASP